MKIKQKPEDFSVRESYRFDEVENGRFRVYLMDKQKVSTFEAVARITEAFGLRPGAISHCGLKDKQGRTEQIIAVDGHDVDMQEDDLRLKYLGKTDRPLSARNITSNRFSVTVRALVDDDFPRLNISAAEVNRLGVINYFDSQRFGSLKHGQGYIAKDLIRGDFEAALHNYMAVPSPLDRSEDADVKAFWKQYWGHWDKKVPFEGQKKYYRVIKSLREKPTDFVSAFLQIDASYRALLLFTYQSYLWNEGVRRLMQLILPREAMFPLPYQAGTVLFHREGPAEALAYLRDTKFPLLAPNSVITDPKIKEAVDWVLGKEKLKLSDLNIREAQQLLFFKHEERPITIIPHKLVLGRRERDELNRGFNKLNVAFTLPPGSYATLVVKRLFHWTYREDTADEVRETQARRFERIEQAGPPGQSDRGGRAEARGGEARGQSPRSDSRGQPPRSDSRARPASGRDAAERPSAKNREPEPLAEAPVRATAAPRAEKRDAKNEGPQGYRERSRLKKEAKAEARAKGPQKQKKPR